VKRSLPRQILALLQQAAVILLMAWPLLSTAQLRSATKAQPVCPAGTKLCSGAFGSQCYSPTSGQTCRSGAVCGTAQQLCQGAYGTSCYTPSLGQQCMQGVVCETGQSICTAGGIPHCYNPDDGGHCQ
jgi:hypothetical protein